MLYLIETSEKEGKENYRSHCMAYFIRVVFLVRSKKKKRIFCIYYFPPGATAPFAFPSVRFSDTHTRWNRQERDIYREDRVTVADRVDDEQREGSGNVF